MPQPHRIHQDFSLSATVAGALAVLVSYAGPLIVVFQAASVAQLSDAATASWIWAISIGSGLSGLWLSWRWRVPVITAWSTPGAALLVAMLPGTPWPQALAAFFFSGALVTLIGVSGVFDRLMAFIPRGMSSALLAGILLRFGIDLFAATPKNPALVLAMLATYLVGKRCFPRYAIAAALLIGLALTFGRQPQLSQHVSLVAAQPLWLTPEWSWSTVLSLGLPLALVTLTGQYVPGIAVLRASGYPVAASPLLSVTGLVSMLMAPFGAHGINLAAITAAICTGREAHELPDRRYIAGMVCGVCYLLAGCFGGTLAVLFRALPPELISSLAGLALLGAINSGLIGTLQSPPEAGRNLDGEREANLLTFLVTASGVSLLGLGAPFWALVLGGTARALACHAWRAKA